MRGLEKDVQSTPASSLLYSLKIPATMVPGKLGLVETKVNVLVGSTLAFGLPKALVCRVHLAAADDEHVRGNRHLMVEVNRFSP